jgi:hypothetical protein
MARCVSPLVTTGSCAALILQFMKRQSREKVHGQLKWEDGNTGGFVYVNEDSIKNKKDFDYWVALALDFNKIAKAAKKKK